MKKATFLLALSILFSCNNESMFDLEKDLYQFSEKMENGDTLEVYVNLSACMYAASERYNFVKENDTLYLETHSEISSFEKQQQTLPKIIYPFKLNNSLSFENYFKYLKNENRAKREYGSSLVTVCYPNKNQRQYFNDDGLGDKFTKLDKLSLIRKKLYPNDKFFETPEPPPPPPSRK
ncbi:hypothetical protein [Chryseobacterium scophthalmum]|uniref:hypothetical protein n=1 Tax=Chryseobacterium scophthalmum TaxID=59733 RepID=UPI001AEBD37E|nr:hypothetical protein [Chryseobacterium scophthalmum]